MKPYLEMADTELLDLGREGDEIAIVTMIERYRRYIRLKCKQYFLVGASAEDVIQEGTIGFYKAIRDFRPEKSPSFRAFAELCMTRQIITAIKTATRQKHTPLNTYVSFSKTAFGDESDRTFLEIFTCNSSDPAEIYEKQEAIEAMKKLVRERLSKLESKVLHGYLEGMSYQEMADMMERPIKSIDNAIQRVKRKLEINIGGA